MKYSVAIILAALAFVALLDDADAQDRQGVHGGRGGGRRGGGGRGGGGRGGGGRWRPPRRPRPPTTPPSGGAPTTTTLAPPSTTQGPLISTCEDGYLFWLCGCEPEDVAACLNVRLSVAQETQITNAVNTCAGQITPPTAPGSLQELLQDLATQMVGCVGFTLGFITVDTTTGAMSINWTAVTTFIGNLESDDPARPAFLANLFQTCINTGADPLGVNQCIMTALQADCNLQCEA